VVTITGGDKLQAALRDMAQKVANPATLSVGFLSGATYPDGTSVPMVAAIQEYGRPPVQPPRPFFRRMIARYSGEWPEAIGGLLKANGYDAEKALELTGAAVAGQLRQSITDLVDPPLAPSTIRRKGFDKPLIDRGILLASVDYEVKT